MRNGKRKLKKEQYHSIKYLAIFWITCIRQYNYTHSQNRRYYGRTCQDTTKSYKPFYKK